MGMHMEFMLGVPFIVEDLAEFIEYLIGDYWIVEHVIQVAMHQEIPEIWVYFHFAGDKHRFLCPAVQCW